jgi:sec-independent protein translocase protein TatB
MFNIHSTELLLVCIVALIVIGPEKLPAAVKTAGLWIGRFRRSFYKVKAEIERELNTDEIRRQLHNESVLAEIESAKADVTGITDEAEKTISNIVSSDNFDPGASQATLKKDKENNKDSISSEVKENFVQEELTEVIEQVDEIGNQIFNSDEKAKLPTTDNKPSSATVNTPETSPETTKDKQSNDSVS